MPSSIMITELIDYCNAVTVVNRIVTNLKLEDVRAFMNLLTSLAVA
jgi:hypothetical protein